MELAIFSVKIFIKAMNMVSLKLIKDNLALAIPILIANVAVIGGGIVSARIVAYGDPINWYLLGLFLPINYLALGLLESGRVCSILTVNSHNKDNNALHDLILLVLIYAVAFLILLAFTIILFALPYNLLSIATELDKKFIFFAVCYLLSYIAVSTNSLLNAALFARAKSGLAMLLIIMVSVLCVVITLMLSRYTQLGIYSLVIASAVSYILGSIASGLFLHKELFCHHLTSSWDFKYGFELFRKFGAPVFIAYLAWPITLLILNKIFIFYGTNAVAGFGIVYRLQSFIILPAIAMGVSAGILINRLNEKIIKFNNVYIKNAVITTLFIYLVIAIGLYLAKPLIAGYFSSNFEVQHVVTLYLKYFAIVYLIFCPQLVLLMVWEQTGLAQRSMFINIGLLSLQIITVYLVYIFNGSLQRIYQWNALVIGLSAVLVLSWFFNKRMIA
jgi:Na+-driven multidrug efflux pump